MTRYFVAGDRVIAIDEQATGVPRGTLGTVSHVFVRVPEICAVQFDGQAGVRTVVIRTLAPVPPTSSAKETTP